jgi:hypothetical protein
MASLPRVLWCALLVSLLSAAVASAHVERPAYFPDPAAEKAGGVSAGGEIPKIRSLASALNKKLPGTTRVVCQSNSLTLVKQSIAKARKSGYEIRPTDKRSLSKKSGDRLMKLNRKLKKLCKYKEIQPAVTASGNNDRVVIMPGLYLEPTARAKPTNDEACQKFRTNGDKPGEEGNALSYAYQFNCPNDQNLIAVMGRSVSSEPDPVPPRSNRHGIPNPGQCIRCNVQIEGSGVSADDVVIDAGDQTKGNKGPNGVGAKKDVVIRADRADGFVLRNVTLRHAGEHGVYVLETDGYVLDRFKAFYSKLYGTLTFASDHGLHSNCETVGHGDSGIYPGGAPETGTQRPVGTKARLNQEIRHCDMHHNLAGYSGTNGNAVWVHHNNIYDNALGIQTDVVTGAGHPGYPGDSAVFEENNIYSNNFNTYAPDSDVKPAFPFPTGTGLWIAGGNHHKVRDNHFYDNWRRGTMVFSVPDSLVCGAAADGNQQAGCDSSKISTSHYNQTHDNRMGIRPDGTADRNGTDFWWDQFAGSRGNCWYRNYAPNGVAITSDPPGLPDCDDGRDPGASLGAGNPENESELVSCVAAFETRNFDPNGPCPWIRPPANPDEGGARAATMTTPFDAPASRSAKRVSGRTMAVSDTPLGQMTCFEWNRATDEQRPRLVAQLKGFAGGVVNDGQRNIGTGAVLAYEDARQLYDGVCSYAYAQEFLLYKLYTHAAAFGHRH